MIGFGYRPGIKTCPAIWIMLLKNNRRNTVTKDDIARTAYNVNAAYCWSLGDHSFGPWEEAPEWQKNSCRLGVDFHIGNPGATAAASHECWLTLKTQEGWKYGYKKDPEKKEHPCMVPFDQLPANQQAKGFLFKSVVDSLRGLLPVQPGCVV